ncbi:MAG: hypothetical protein JWP11_851 [Frankiales bacterium]|nr:hypothetical protein [Frankiales bacterium]
MTDQLDSLLAHTAEHLSRDVVAPPSGPLLARARRRRVLRVAVPTVLTPLLAATLAVALGAGPSLVLPGHHGLRTVYARGGPELGHLPLPAAARAQLAELGGDLAADAPADLLAVATTKNGRARLIGFQRRSGARCVFQDYVVPFLNSNGGVDCGLNGREPLDRQPITVAGSADSTPGSIKAAPISFGSAPPGTRTVEFTAPATQTVRAVARDGGPAYRHRSFFLTSWPVGVSSTVRALDAQGRELARVQLPGQDARQVARQCQDVAGVLLSHLQRATLVGTKWARAHPQSGDAARLRFLDGVAVGPGRHVARESEALARLQLADAEASRLGPEETYEYRLAAVLLLGDGKGCFTGPILSTAREFLSKTR